MSRRLFWLLSSLLVALWSSVARASLAFPGEIAKTLSLSYSPACTLCHATEEGADSAPSYNPPGTSARAART
ncbi:MAG TPA: hypothetical protein VK540_07105 [Polyangiaceae bacterium]|jgi:hypothetical protein|nr:hypothetical protein [Polyangiaceae bacterium]